MVDSVDGLDVREKSVTETGTLRGTLDQTSNVGDAEVGGVLRWRVPDLCEVVVTRVGDCRKLVGGSGMACCGPGVRTGTPRSAGYMLALAERKGFGEADGLLIRLNCTEGVVFRGSGLRCEEVEKTGFSNVGQPDHSHLKVILHPAEADDISSFDEGFLGRHYNGIDDGRR